MARRIHLVHVGMGEFLVDERGERLGRLPQAGQMAGGQLRLQLGARPDAADRLEKADEIEVLQPLRIIFW